MSDLRKTLEKIIAFKCDLEEHQPNLPDHFWETIGECISELNEQDGPEKELAADAYSRIKEKRQGEHPMGTIGYIYEEFDGTYQMGMLTVLWRDDVKNIKRMEELTTRPGFVEFSI